VACMLSQWLHVHCWLQLWILSRTPTLPADYSYDTVIAKIDSLGLNTTSLGYVLSPSAPLSLRCVRLLVPTCSGALVAHPHLHPLSSPCRAVCPRPCRSPAASTKLEASAQCTLLPPCVQVSYCFVRLRGSLQCGGSPVGAQTTPAPAPQVRTCGNAAGVILSLSCACGGTPPVESRGHWTQHLFSCLTTAFSSCTSALCTRPEASTNCVTSSSVAQGTQCGAFQAVVHEGAKELSRS
jgi:hypothetical protein